MESIGRYSAAVYRLSQGLFNHKLRELGISSGQHDFFLVIARNEGISQKEICDHLYVDKSTTAKAVRNLVDKGYIYNKQIEHDKRFSSLYLTEKGRQAAATVQAVFAEMMGIFARDIPESTVEQTIGVLQQVIANLQEEKKRCIRE